MKFEYTHYKVTEKQPLEKIEAYLKNIGAFPDTKWNEPMKSDEGLLYVILYPDGEYEFHLHTGASPESFIQKTPTK